MEHTKRNRGKTAEDDALFSNEKQINKLREALKDLNYLLTRGYTIKSSLALAAGRYKLRSRQLTALQGMACAEAEVLNRIEKQVAENHIAGKEIFLDGFNIIIVLESFFSGAYIFKGQDGCYRDISSVHGTYKRVLQTEQVLTTVGKLFLEAGAGKITWVFDKPVSNSGKMKTMCYEVAAAHNFNWDAILENSPDKYLAECNGIVCSSDAWILNECKKWFNLTANIIENHKVQKINANIIVP
ncbi:DUF434 domain-containing protein [Flavobacterium sp. RNTU_13]|uniref:DUF434 domain-containing protein n=1 Tax=Flavobacterium sp. RNTU_13 TaxID=3375145 RepID=UPI0039883AF6